MKNIPLLFLLVLLISCSRERENGSQQLINQRLANLDKSIYTSPKQVIDSLDRIDNMILNEENRAYSRLIRTISFEYLNGKTPSDTAILVPSYIFRAKEDTYNYTRALLFNGAALFNTNRNDSTAYTLIRDAENQFVRTGIKDYNLGSTLYLYLGRIYRARDNREEATKAVIKCMELCNKAGNKYTMLNARLELFWINFGQRQYTDALLQLTYFADETDLPPYLSYNLSNALYYYHTAKKDYTIAVEYLKKMMQTAKDAKLDVNYSQLHYMVAASFKRHGNRDSTLYYSKLSVASIRDSASINGHFYHRYLAELYAENGDYKEAYESYKKAYQIYIRAFTKINQERVTEIERKYDIKSRETIIKSLKNQRTILIFTIIGITVLSLATLYILSRVLKKHHKKAVTAVKDKVHFKQENRKLWITSELCKNTSFVLPQLIDGVYKEALRCRKVSSDTFDSLNSVIDQANLMTRSALSSITSREEFMEMYSHLPNMDKLTDYEKLIYVLSEDGFSNQEIGDFLNTTQSSIRSLKGRIHKKIQQNDDDSSENE